MSRARVYTFLSCLILAGAAFLLAQSQAHKRTPVPPQAYTLKYREGPVEDRQRHRILAVRSDGSRVEMTAESSPGYEGWDPKRLILPGERRRFLIAERARLVSTYYLSPQEAERIALPTISEKCLHDVGRGDQLIGEESILGVKVYHYMGKSGRAGYTLESWNAPSLGCQSLQDVTTFTSDDGTSQRTFERVPLTLVLGEPDSKLFLPPDGFREVPPSEQQKEVLGLMRGKPFGSVPKDERLLRGFESFDRGYNLAQKNRP
jgi:hypothetical protein